jgi:hypothetical protein
MWRQEGCGNRKQEDVATEKDVAAERKDVATEKDVARKDVATEKDVAAESSESEYVAAERKDVPTEIEGVPCPGHIICTSDEAEAVNPEAELDFQEIIFNAICSTPGLCTGAKLKFERC